MTSKIEIGTKSICFCLRHITFERYGEDDFEFWRDTDGFVCIDNHWHRPTPPAAVPVPEKDWNHIEMILWKYHGIPEGWIPWLEGSLAGKREGDKVAMVRLSAFNRLLDAYMKLKGERRL